MTFINRLLQKGEQHPAIWDCSNYVLHNHHGLFMHQLLHLMSSKLTMNDQIVGHTEYKIHLRSDLRIYCPTSEFSVRPQILVSDLRVYCPTSEFYCPTWVFGSSNFSPTWPGGSVLVYGSNFNMDIFPNIVTFWQLFNSCLQALFAFFQFFNRFNWFYTGQSCEPKSRKPGSRYLKSSGGMP